MSLSSDMACRFTMSFVLTLATPECVFASTYVKIKIQKKKKKYPPRILLIPGLVQCNSVFGRARTMRYVVAQTVLDLLGDLLSKYITPDSNTEEL